MTYPPHPARERATFPPRGRLLRRGGVTPPYGAIKIRRTVGAGHAPPAVKWWRKNHGLGCRHGYYAARCSHTKKCGIPEKPHGTHICVPYKPAGNAEPSRDCAAIKIHRPKPYITMNIMGWFVGAAYMPPVTTARILQYIGKTARDAYMRPLQTCRK